MNEQSQVIYSTLQDIFKNIWEQQKYSEVKNGVLLTLNITIFVIVTRVYFYINEIVNNNIVYKGLFFTLFLLFLIHIIIIVQSFFPKNINKENIKWSNDKINIFFFGDIQKIESEQYLKIVIERLNIKEKELNRELLLNISNQIVILSEITQSKYISFKYSIYRMYGITTLFFIYFSYLFFK